MSADNYAAMTTERLLALFVEAAKKTGAGSGLFGLLDDIAASVPPEKAHPVSASPEATAAVQALGAALRARKPIAQIRRLFEDDDRDVCACAAGQFGSIDPDWAAATRTGLFANLPTRQVLALTLRARQAPPDRPTLKEMSDDAWRASRTRRRASTRPDFSTARKSRRTWRRKTGSQASWSTSCRS